MGANAQTSVPLYAAAEVLTAANMNISAGTGVPVFATTVTRDAAFGGAGEKVLAEGQLAYIEASNIVQYYDGAAWATVGPATGGLTCVKAETAFTAASTITADNVFTSSYTNYILQMTSFTANNANATLQLRAGGVTSTAANYNGQSLQVNSTTVSSARSSGATSVDFFTTSQGVTLYNFAQMTIYQPQLAQATGFQSFSQYHNSASYGQPLRLDFFSNNSLTTAFDGFIISLSGGFTMSGSYAVYGYSKTV